jgi:hypothetical protein
MRTIKFRGKGIKGNWYEGLVSHNIAKDEWYISNKVGIATAYQVRPETIGQFTGLLDKNGKEIYEGDIVKCDKFVYEVVFEEKRFASYGLCRKGDMFMHYFGEAMESQQCEAIGNIHDNLELIKGE